MKELTTTGKLRAARKAIAYHLANSEAMRSEIARLTQVVAQYELSLKVATERMVDVEKSNQRFMAETQAAGVVAAAARHESDLQRRAKNHVEMLLREERQKSTRYQLMLACKDLALEKGQAAILVAVTNENGLDGADGERVAVLMDAALHAEVRLSEGK